MKREIACETSVPYRWRSPYGPVADQINGPTVPGYQHALPSSGATCAVANGLASWPAGWLAGCWDPGGTREGGKCLVIPTGQPGSLAPCDSVEVLSRCPGEILGRDRDLQCDECVCECLFALFAKATLFHHLSLTLAGF
jgi:hypothetical protein